MPIVMARYSDLFYRLERHAVISQSEEIFQHGCKACWAIQSANNRGSDVVGLF